MKIRSGISALLAIGALAAIVAGPGAAKPGETAAVLAATAQATSFPIHLGTPGTQPTIAACPPGATADDSCQGLSGGGVARGLGAWHIIATVAFHRGAQGFDSIVVGSLSTARGTLAFEGDNSTDPKHILRYAIVLTGNGGFASVTGNGTFAFIGSASGGGTFDLDATLELGSVTLDLTAPTLRVKGATARRVAGGKAAVTVRYTATDAGRPVTAQLYRAGAARPLASAAEGASISARLKVPASVHHLVLRLAVTDASGNTTTRALTVSLGHG